MGRELFVSENPRRIVSLAPSITEILFALGVGDRIVGTTEFSDFPPEALRIPSVGTYIKPNLERIVELKPDLVIATPDGDKKAEVEKLSSLGIPVFVVDPKTIDDIVSTVAEIADLVGAEEDGRKLAEEMERRVREVSNIVAGRRRVSVLIQINGDPIICAGAGTFQDDLIGRAGGKNVATVEKIRYPRLSLEQVIVLAPECIIISSMGKGRDFEAEMQTWRCWKSIPAVRDNKIYIVDSDIIDRASPRIVSGLEAIARILHPEAFK